MATHPMTTLVDYVANIGVNGSDINGLERRLDKLGGQYTDAQKREEYPQLLHQSINLVQDRHTGYAKQSRKYLVLSAVGLVAGFSLMGIPRDALGPLEEFITYGLALLIPYSTCRSAYAVCLQSNMARAKGILEQRLESIPQ